MKKILNIVGTRPNFVKIAPLMLAYKAQNSIYPLLVHTGQHYDINMSDVFFRELNIPEPDYHLNVGSGSQAKQVADIMTAFEKVCLKEKPDGVLVAGDVNSTMACALVAVKLGIKCIHLEAGLRSFDRTMPEEINRIVTDSVSDLLLIPSEDARINLIKEGIQENKIHFVGNIMVDTLLRFLPLARNSGILEKLGMASGQYVLVTLHRPDNVDDPENLKLILSALDKLTGKIKVILPIHPRTLNNIKTYKLEIFLKSLNVVEPLGYFDFMKLMVNAGLVITDSGGIQEETTVLGVPCITVRKNTERPVTVTEGTNEIIGKDMERLVSSIDTVLSGKWKNGKVPELWDGHTAERVVKILIEHFI